MSPSSIADRAGVRLSKTLPEAPLRRISTADVPESQGLDYYATAMQEALIPMSLQCPSRKSFHAAVESTSLGQIEVLRMVGSAHRVVRGTAELERSDRRMYNLMINRLAPWKLVQRGRNLLQPGDAVLLDSAHPHELEVDTYELINLAMTAEFLEQWLPDPAMLTALPLTRESSWSAPLTRFVAQLTPEFVHGSCPLPDEVMTQQIGALLMLAAGGHMRDSRRGMSSWASVHAAILEQMHERFSEADLTAAAVAQELDIDQRMLHDVLALHGKTFAALLLILRTKEFHRLSTAQQTQELDFDAISRLSGFKDSKKLAAALRNQSGSFAKDSGPAAHGPS